MVRSREQLKLAMEQKGNIIPRKYVNIVAGTIVIKVSNVNPQNIQINQQSLLFSIHSINVLFVDPYLMRAYYVLDFEMFKEGRHSHGPHGA